MTKRLPQTKIGASLTGNQVETDLALAHLYAVSGKRDEARQIVKAIEQEKHRFANFYRGLALVYAALGEDEKTFKLLGKSYKMREESLMNIKVDPKLERLYSDSRFIELLRKIGVGK